MTLVLLCLQIICGVGLAKNPINGDNTTPQGLDTTLYEWGVVDPTERRVLHQMVREKAELTMQAIMEYEETLTAEERGNLGAQTDIVGELWCWHVYVHTYRHGSTFFSSLVNSLLHDL